MRRRRREGRKRMGGEEEEVSEGARLKSPGDQCKVFNNP